MRSPSSGHPLAESLSFSREVEELQIKMSFQKVQSSDGHVNICPIIMCLNLWFKSERHVIQFLINRT